MYDALRMGKKALTWWVVGATILWAMSAAFLVLPLTAKAATLTAGDLIRGTEKSVYGGYPVYYYGTDGKKYLFPTSDTYSTWYSDFSGVKVLTQAELEAVPFGGNATFRPGVKMVKFPGDAKVYAVDKGGVLRHVTSETVAVALYGAEWYKPANLTVVPEGFQANYSMTGAAINAATDYVKATVMASAPDIGTDKGIGATPTVSGALTAALASTNPVGQVIPQGSTGATVLAVNLTAGSSAVTVSGATVKVTGVGAASDFQNVYLYDGAIRLTSGRSLPSQTKQAEFNGLGLSVAAGTTKTLYVVVDVSSTAASGDTHQFSLSSLGTTASVAGLSVSGNTMSIGSQDVSNVDVQSGTAPSNPTIGQTGASISEFKLTAGTNDVEVRRLTLTVGGTVTTADLSNFELYQSGTKIATGSLLSDRVTFDLSSAPYQLSQGTTRPFTVKATVSGRSGRTIITYFDSSYPSDMVVVDKIYGFGANVRWNGDATVPSACVASGFCSSANGVTVTTLGGKVTVAFNGPSASDISVGSQDAVLYKFSLTAAEQAVEFRKLAISLDGGAALDEMSDDDSGSQVNFFTDIKVKNLDTGAVLMGPKEITATGDVTAAQAFTFTDAWTLDAGKTVNLAVTADLRNTTDADFVDNAYVVTLTQIGADYVREVSTSQYLATTDIVPNPATGSDGYNMTVRASALTVQLASTPISGTTVKGSTYVQMVGFSFAAGAQSDVKVTQIKLTGQGDDTGGTYTVGELDDVVISARLYDGDTALSDWKSPASDGTITFDNMNWTITAGATKKVIAKVNLATTLMSSAADTAWLGIAAALDVSAQDKDSNTVTPTDGDATWSGPVNSTPTVLLTVNTAGTLTVATDGDTPLATIATGGTSGVNVTKLKFTSANESFLIKKLRVTNEGTDSLGNTCDGTETSPQEFPSSCDTGVTTVKISYPTAAGTTEEKSAYLSNGIADFSDLNFFAKLDQNSVMTIKADLASISESAISGDQLDFGIDFDSNFEAVGQGSGSTLSTCAGLTAGTGVTCDTDTATSGGVDVSGNAVTVRKSKPAVSLAASSPSGASVPGLNEVLRFTVAADATGDIVLDVVTFKATTTDNGTSSWNVNADPTGNIDLTSSWSLYDASDLTTQKEAGDGDWTLYGAAAGDGTLDGTETVGYARLALTTPITVAAGTSKTFVLKVDTTGASSANDDTVRFDVVEEGGSVNTTLAATTEFQWDETSSGAATNITGTLVKNLPVNGGTIVY